MARRGENIYHRKDGRYEGRYVIGKKEDGRTAFGYVYGKKYSEVKQKLNLRKVEMQSEAMKHTTVISSLSIKEWMMIWLDEYMNERVKASTYAIYRGQIEKYILPMIGKIQLNKIDSMIFQTLYDGVIQSSRNEKIANTICQRFQASLILAQKEGYLSYLPKYTAPKRRICKEEPAYLTRKEEATILHSLNLDQKKDIAVFISLMTGIRIGECCALKWQNIDMKNQEIHITHTVQRVKTYQKDCKTKLMYAEAKTQNAIRIIPIVDPLQQVLLNFKKKESPSNDDFLLGKGNRPMDPRVLQNHIYKIRTEFGIENLHFHTLRHTFATRCLELQIDMKSLSEMLGHSSVKNTLDWYCHSSFEQKKKMLEQHAAYIL